MVGKCGYRDDDERRFADEPVRDLRRAGLRREDERVTDERLLVDTPRAEDFRLERASRRELLELARFVLRRDDPVFARRLADERFEVRRDDARLDLRLDGALELPARLDFLELFALRGTFPPDVRASDSPMAIACFGSVTFLPERPDRSLPRFISCIARSTFSSDFLPYLRRPPLLESAI